ncbi:MAG: RHS repeat domain-containing protein, partial [Planctomycetota bacterium]
MKRLLVILSLWSWCAGPVYAECKILGWVTSSDNVKYVALLTEPWEANQYILVEFRYFGYWYQYDPGWTYFRLVCPTPCEYYEWDGDLDELWEDYDWCIDDACDLDAVAAAKEFIDANNGIEDYLDDTWPDGGSDPNFGYYFIDWVEGGDPDMGEANAPFENSSVTTDRGDPVFMSNGEYRLSVTDLSIPGRGLSVEIVRTYGSRREYNSRFGYGWDMNYNMKVRRLVPIAGEPNTVVLLDGGGYRREYTQDGADPNLYERDEDLSDHLDFNDADNTFTLVKKSGTEYKFDPNGNLASIEDRNGNTITLTYDSNGRSPIYGHSKFFHIEHFGGPPGKYGLVAREYKLTTITDALGRKINLTYDSNGLLSTITEDLTNRTWTYTYEPYSNDLLSMQDPNGLITSYSYDYRHNLESITDPNDQTYITNHYDFNDKVDWQIYGDANYIFVYDEPNTATITDRERHVTQMLYSDAGQVLSETVYTDDPNAEPNSYTTEYAYNTNLELIRTIFPAGNCIEYTYDDLNDVNGVYRKIGPEEPNNGSDPNVIATLYTYDPIHVHEINSITDPMGNITGFEYDAYGNVKKIIYPEVAVFGQENQRPVVEYTYNEHGQVETVTDPNGIVTKYEYYSDSDPNDPNYGKLRKVIVDYDDPDGLNITTTYKYDTYGNVREVNDPNGDVTKFQYNELDLLTKTTDPYDNVTKFLYNKNKKLSRIERVRVSDSNQITDYDYDILDHLVEVNNPLGYPTRYGYNKNEDPNIVTDAEGRDTVSVYDERGLLIEVIDANGDSTKYTYTANGDINDVNDAKGNITRYEYDGFGRLKKIIYPDDSEEVFGYDKNSNLISKTNRGGVEIKYKYDALNRMTAKEREGDPNIYFAYDISGRVREVNDLRSVAEGGGITTYTYDRVGRVIEVNDIESRVAKYKYDQLGRRSELIYPNTKKITYQYDALSRLTNVRYYSASLVTYEYDELSRRTKATLLNDSNAVYEYDLGDRLLKLTNNIDEGNSIIFEYGRYDKVGNRLSMKVDDANAHVYEYDNLYQLIFVDYNDGNGTDYYYDPLGNRSKVDDGPAPVLYDTNCLNQYTAVGPQGGKLNY